ncbi:MAG: hypothetical protein E7513_04805 [Ruminococcaceae bacterium]|nr:hypothetical protein [Oscillospiraceae bacterium]
MKKLCVVISILLLFTLCGCSVLSLEESNIMSPPKATGEKAKIQKLIDKETSGSYTLKYPKNGANRSSIVMHSFDEDEDEEAIALYSDKEGDHIHALFFDIIDDEYTIISDILLEAAGIDRVDFADINGDSVNEILIGYSTSTSSQNILNIFSYQQDEIAKLDIACAYSSLITGDFNYDKHDDILLISLFSGDVAAQATLMIYNSEGSLSELGSTELDSDITQLAATTYAQLSYGTYGAVIDGISSTGDYTTQIVYFDKEQPALINPLYSYSGYSNTRRSTQVCCVDFDKDELIDIPICSLMGYDESEDMNKVLRRIDWSNFDTETYALSTIESSILCTADGYMLDMPSKWSDTITARYNVKERETTIYAIEYKNNTLTLKDELLVIKAFSVDEYNKDSSGFTEFLSTGSTVYTYSIGNADNYLSITGDEVSSLFSLVNQ